MSGARPNRDLRRPAAMITQAGNMGFSWLSIALLRLLKGAQSLVRNESIDSLWLDRPDAEEEARRRARNLPPIYLETAREMIRDGFTVLKGAIDPARCDATVEDYVAYLDKNQRYAEKNVDALGRHKRFVNFHLASVPAMRIGCDKTIMALLDFLFGYRAALYTSLCFEYGTEQSLHRDSPFFHTFPRNYFFGVWIALEDIHEDSGPLMYVPGGHRFVCDPRPIYQQVLREHSDRPSNGLLKQALRVYHGEVVRMAAEVGPIKTALLRKGDVAIWHAQLPHGGSPARNPALTRRSIVFHNAPEQIQVYEKEVFFQRGRDTPPLPRYGFKRFGNRLYAHAGRPVFQ